MTATAAAPATAAPAADDRALRDAFGAFPTGVTVAATLDADGRPVGFTANSFTSVSLDPPLLLVCQGRRASTHAAFAAAERFAVSVLSAGQRALAAAFAQRGIDRFAGVAWRAEATGAPVLDGAAAWFDCVAEQRVPAGDHMLLIGRVRAFGRADRAPLAYLSGGFATVSAGL